MPPCLAVILKEEMVGLTYPSRHSIGFGIRQSAVPGNMRLMLLFSHFNMRLNGTK